MKRVNGNIPTPTNCAYQFYTGRLLLWAKRITSETLVLDADCEGVWAGTRVYKRPARPEHYAGMDSCILLVNVLVDDAGSINEVVRRHT